MDIKKALESRKEHKATKPKFTRQNADTREILGKKNQKHIKVRVGTSYRRPRGCSSRARIRLKGYPRRPSPGYGSPACVKGKSADGLNIVVVSNIDDISNSNPKEDTIVIGSNVGNKKALLLFAKAKESGFSIENFDETRVASITLKFEESKSVNKKAKEKKSKQQTEKLESEKKKKTEKKEDKTSPEEEKKKEIQEKEKIITKKESSM